MDAPPAVTLESMMADHSLPEETLDAVKNFTPELFALVAPDLVHFETFLGTLPGCSDPLVAAQMCLLFTRCQRAQDRGSTGSLAPETKAQASAVTLAATGWDERFPPKLASEVVLQMKTKFLDSCPGEVLDASNIPSIRMLSLVSKQCSSRDFRWVPWKYRMTQRALDELTTKEDAQVGSLRPPL